MRRGTLLAMAAERSSMSRMLLGPIDPQINGLQQHPSSRFATETPLSEIDGSDTDPGLDLARSDSTC
jgi:hypothetical protein